MNSHMTTEQLLAVMRTARDRTELSERGKEVIVPRVGRRRDEPLHGPGDGSVLLNEHNRGHRRYSVGVARLVTGPLLIQQRSKTHAVLLIESAGVRGVVLRNSVELHVAAGSAGAPLAIVVMTSPRGVRLDPALARRFADHGRLIVACGRYEGVDERVAEHLADEEVSIGDYVLSGGEIPAMVVVDAVTRLLPGALGCHESAEQDSFSNGLLDYPHYTRPAEYRGLKVPDVLLGGHHAEIDKWRRERALEKTRKSRPDLLAEQAKRDE